MTSEELRQMIPEYLAGRLGESGARLFEAQLNANPELRIELEELRLAWEGLGLLPAEQPSPALRAQFYRRLHDMQSGRVPAMQGGFAWWKPGLSGLVRQVAVLGVLFAVGLYVGRVTVRKPASAPNTDVAQLQVQVQSLRQTVALSLLERPSAESRLEGVTWSSQVAHPDNDLLHALIGTLQHDSNTNVRLAALDALENFSNEPSVRQALVNALATQDSPLVQIALIDSLVHMRDKSAAPAFRSLSNESTANAAVRQRAQWALQTMKF